MKWVLKPGRSRSLKWKLVTQVSLLLVVLLLIINMGFVAYILSLFPRVNGPDERVRPAIVASLTVSNGFLAIIPTDKIIAVKEQSPAFWFAAWSADHGTAIYGDVPPEFTAIIAGLDTIVAFNASETTNSPLTASLVELRTTFGDVRVIHGGKSFSGSPALHLFWGLKILYLPTILIPLFSLFFVIPLIVDRAFKGLERTAERAALIDLDTPHIRLPTDENVRELDPLVGAVNQALSRIEDNLKLRQRFLANAAHELRTPIAILHTRLESLPESASRTRLLLDVARLEAIAEQLLDMQRFGMVQTMTDIDLVKTCRRVVADLAPMAIAEDFEIELHCNSAPVMIRADEVSVERAVTNLVRNAIEHSGVKGLISLEVGDAGTVDVVDQGVGVPLEDSDRIFEPFHRSAPKPFGAGLGLSLVRQIMQSHGGSVALIRRVTGARFRLNFRKSVDAPPERTEVA